jgi:hypothetical protein
MWYESLKDSKRWSSLWYGRIRCSCGGIRRLSGTCDACGQPLPEPEWMEVRGADGQVVRIPPAYMGAESQYQDYVFLDLLAAQWLRPTTQEEEFESIAESHRPAAKAIVVLVFWTYFEAKIERLLREPNRGAIPPRVLDDLLQRHASIGSRLGRAYKVLFDTTYFAELKALGFSELADVMKEVQTARNAFVHGHPEAITTALTQKLVENLENEHNAWIAAFNARMAARAARRSGSMLQG